MTGTVKAPDDWRLFYLAIYEAADEVMGDDNPLPRLLEAGTTYAMTVAATVWGYPIQQFWETQGVFVTQPDEFAPINTMYLAPNIDTSTIIVSPNTSVLYAQAWLDMTETPFIASYPDEDGVYTILQVLDAYTNVQGSAGTRVPTDDDEVVIYWANAPYADEVAAQYPNAIAVETPQAWLLGRLAVDTYAVEAEDGDPATPYQEGTGSASSALALWHVQDLLDEFTLTADTSVTPSTGALKPSPVTNAATTATEFFTSLADAVSANGLTVQYKGLDGGALVGTSDDWTVYVQSQLFSRFGRIGLTEDGFDPQATDLDTIDAAWADAVSVISALATSAAPTDYSSNWVVNTALGQYQPGAEGWVEAAAVADIGLGANIAADGTYPQATVDADGAILDGANDYQIDFGSDLPPVDGGYWSVTVYSADGTIYPSTGNAYYYTEAIGGVYALGSIQFPSDTDITLYLQNEAPDAESLERYWLPVPDDTFIVTMRLYDPVAANTGEDSILNAPGFSDYWSPPGIEKVSADDNVLGTVGPDTIVAGGGNDRVQGLAGDDLLDGQAGDDVLHGDDGDDTITGGAGNDTMAGGGGSNVLEPGSGVDSIVLSGIANRILGTAAELNGDVVEGFSAGANVIAVTGRLFGRNDITVVDGSATLLIDTDADGTSDTTVTLEGEFADGDFMAVVSGANTEITFNTFLPTLADAISVDPAVVNGILNQAFLHGDNAAAFEVELLGLGFAAFDNVLGAYEIDQDGVIVDARLVSSNTNADVGRTVLVDDIDKGNQLGFFMVQDGADELVALNGEPLLTFVAQGGAPASLPGGAELSLFVNVQALQRPIWHSFSPELNSDGLEHTLSGVEPGGEAIVVGFEDLAGGGDRDYEDVTFRVTAVDELLS